MQKNLIGFFFFNKWWKISILKFKFPQSDFWNNYNLIKE